MFTPICLAINSHCLRKWKRAHTKEDLLKVDPYQCCSHCSILALINVLNVCRFWTHNNHDFGSFFTNESEGFTLFSFLFKISLAAEQHYALEAYSYAIRHLQMTYYIHSRLEIIILWTCNERSSFGHQLESLKVHPFKRHTCFILLITSKHV